jgi:hypothetical protein
VTIKEAHQQLKAAFPDATYIGVNVDTHWWRHCGDKAEVQYTVAVNDGDRRRYQESCVSDLNAVVVTIIASATPTLPTDLETLSREVAAMQDIHGADGLAEMSNDQG